MDPRYVGLKGNKILKKDWDNGKKYPWAESEIFMYLYVREIKSNSPIQKCESPIQEGF